MQVSTGLELTNGAYPATSNKGRTADCSDADGGRLQDRLLAMGAVSQQLVRDDSDLRGVAGLPGAPFLATFLAADNLHKLMRRELPDPEALDRFVRIEPRKSLRLVPKGCVCHWIAGNVPLLGVFSWAISAVLGNQNRIRLSSRQQDFLSPILQCLRTVSRAGRDMAEATCVLSFDRDDAEANRKMSEIADVRIAWGGQEAVASITALPRKWDCEDIVLGPRKSVAVVDPNLMSSSAVSRLATDIAYFDQLACSSPQIVFAKGSTTDGSFAAFLDDLSGALAAQSRRFPRHALDFAETYQIQLDRARALLSGGQLRRDDRTEWTLAVLDKPQPDVRCVNRFVQLVPFSDFGEVFSVLPTNLQTIVTQLATDDYDDFTNRGAASGACRFPMPGEGNHFEVPWDGLPVVSKLLRWVVRTEPS